MLPQFSPQQLKRTKWGEYLVRFAFGGGVSVAAWMIGKAFGPRIGGLFLAFPAILPASLTLIKEHDGRGAAKDDALGAALGSLGLGAFALVVWGTAAWDAPTLTLVSASVLWFVVSASAWWLVFGRRQPARHVRCTPSGKTEAHGEYQSQ
jgi:hypothetical protein